MEKENNSTPQQWWQKDAYRLGLLIIAFIVVIALLYQVEWSGLQDKNVWDWLEIIIVPVVLASGGLLFQRIEDARASREAEIEEERLKAEEARERQQAKDTLMDSIFQSYLDDISKLMIDHRLQTMLEILDKNNSSSDDGMNEDDPVKANVIVSVARARTLTAFHSLDTTRRDMLLNFLRESGLVIDRLNGTLLVGMKFNDVDLSGANLYEFNLSNASFKEANLDSATLINANLTRTQFTDTNFKDANLYGVDLTGAILTGSYLSGANLADSLLTETTILPDPPESPLPGRANVKGWQEDTDMGRYTNPEHPDFWQPDYLKENYSGDDMPQWAKKSD